MRVRGFLAVAVSVLVVALPMTGVASAADNVTLVKSIPESGVQTVKVPAGNIARFKIPSNATTGYTYTITTLMNTAQAAVSDPKYVAPSAAIPGKGGSTVVLVIPMHSGVTVVKFTNVAPGGASAGSSRVRLLFMN